MKIIRKLLRPIARWVYREDHGATAGDVLRDWECDSEIKRLAEVKLLGRIKDLRRHYYNRIRTLRRRHAKELDRDYCPECVKRIKDVEKAGGQV